MTDALPRSGVIDHETPATTPPSTTSRRPYGGLSPADRRADRRQRFLDAGLELYGTIGYASTTITALCRQANVSSVNFYVEFATQEEVIVALADELTADAMDEIAQAMAAVPRDMASWARAAVATWCKYLLADERRARVLLVEVIGVSEGVEQHRRDLARQYAEFIMIMFEEVADHEVRVGRTPQAWAFASALVGAVHEGLITCVLDDDPIPAESVTDALVALFVAAGEFVARPI